MNAIIRVIKEILWTCGNVLVLRIHSDTGGEFWNEVSKEVISRLGIMQTRTEGYDPHANGRAESFVGILKHRATGHLLANRHPVKFWYWTMRLETFCAGVEYPTWLFQTMHQCMGKKS